MRLFVTLLCLGTCVLLTTCGPAPTALDIIRYHGEIRVITRNASTTHYLGAHGPTGLEYDLAQGFAQRLGVKLKIYNAEDFRDIFQHVATRQANIAAAGLTVTDSRQQNFSFSRPYQAVRQLLVYRMGTSRPNTISDILDGQIAVTGGSTFVDTLQVLQLNYPQLHWREAPEASSVEELLQKVASRELDYTIVDSTDFEVNRNYFPELRAAFELSGDQELGWAMAKSSDTSLKKEVDSYLSELEENGRLKELKTLYYDRDHNLDYVGTRKFVRDVRDRLQQYRHWFEEAGDLTKTDWQLLAAVSYQESHWNKNAVSPTGVRGLMMLTQATARQMGVGDRTDPRESIIGGSRYLRRLKGKLPERITEPDRTWLALAAYNVGFGHLEDARVLTQRQGMSPDKWDDVRKHLPLLAQQQWFSKTRRGYARGWEPVIYVDNIQSYYSVLEWAMSDRNPSARWFQTPPLEDEASDQSGSVSAL